MQIPSNVAVVGRYRDGAPVLATAGTTVIIGHINDYRQGPGAFARLSALHRNAVIYLTSPRGTRTAWSVQSVQAIPKAELPQSLFTTSGPRLLALVTCGGVLQASGHYADNVIVLARPIVVR
jgi:hypothetical protein